MSDEWLVIPGERVGKIVCTTSAQDLLRDYGADSLLIDPDLRTGAGLIPAGDPSSMLDLSWIDVKGCRGVREVRAAYGRFQWRTPHGLVHGTTVTDAAAFNGAALTIEPGGVVNGPANQLRELGVTLFLTFKPTSASDLPEQILKRYLQGPPWASDDPEMLPLTSRMLLKELRVVLAP